MDNKLKNIQLKEEFDKMLDEELSDYKFLSNFIYNRVGIYLHFVNCEIKNPEKMTCWGGLDCKQYPDELAKLLVFLYKNDINSYCDIGSHKGGTFYVIDSFLRSVNPNMGNSLALDLRKTILKFGFKEYKKKYPEVDFLQIDSREFIPSRKYDFCFIDGDHSYKSVKYDYENMKKYCKIICLHDIKLTIRQYEGAKKLWKEIKDCEKIEFLNEDKNFTLPVGIGAIINNE